MEGLTRRPNRAQTLGLVLATGGLCLRIFGGWILEAKESQGFVRPRSTNPPALSGRDHGETPSGSRITTAADKEQALAVIRY